ncbi:hypothetical protein IMZ48_23695 [Candidatus Bathyarchaeota archaeon]|nr:hypothetical protein [Candidatus Bathyarchaeota archaeon]
MKEFLRLCQAVGVGFLIMGAVGYIVKLSTSSPRLFMLPQPPRSSRHTLTLSKYTFPSTTSSSAARRWVSENSLERPSEQARTIGPTIPTAGCPPGCTSLHLQVGDEHVS